MLWEAKALAIMLVGIGVKLAIYDPMASPHAHFALAQRLALGLPIASCFGVNLFHHVCVKTWHLYSWHALVSQPSHTLVVSARIGLLIACGVVCIAPLAPLPFAFTLAAFSMGQCALMQLHNGRVAILGTRPHPMREMPNALLALQHRRKGAAKAATAAAAESMAKELYSAPGAGGAGPNAKAQAGKQIV